MGAVTEGDAVDSPGPVVQDENSRAVSQARVVGAGPRLFRTSEPPRTSGGEKGLPRGSLRPFRGREVVVRGGVRFRREVEARRSRARLYPVTVLYTGFTLVAPGGPAVLPRARVVPALRGRGNRAGLRDRGVGAPLGPLLPLQERYFRYIRRHHLYHHSPKGMEIAYGLTNGFWDIVYETRIPPDIRRALYGPLRRHPAPRPRASAGSNPSGTAVRAYPSIQAGALQPLQGGFPWRNTSTASCCRYRGRT